MNLCNGGPAKPTLTPPMPFQRGVRRRPTLVNNAETLAQLALIARHGPRWFRALGTPADPGSALVTLSGAVAHPGVYEIEHGAPLPALIEAAGGSDLGAPRRAARRLRRHVGRRRRDPRARARKRAARRPRRIARRGGRGAALRAGVPGGRDRARDALAGRAERRPMRALRARPGRDRRRDRRGRPRRRDGRGGRAHRPLVHARDRAWGMPSPRRRRALHHQRACEVFAEEFADHARHGRCDACASAPELPLPDHDPSSWPRPRESTIEHAPEGQPDRLRGPRHVRRAAARADHPGRLGLPDPRRAPDCRPS